jgi:hypothetical protein
LAGPKAGVDAFRYGVLAWRTERGEEELFTMPVEDIETVNHHCGDLLECGVERAAKNEA